MVRGKVRQFVDTPERQAGRQAGLDCSYSSDEIMTELGSHTRN